MGKLLCIEIPKDEHAGMIFIRLSTGEALLVQNCEYSTFKFDLENSKYILFDAVGYIKNVEPPTDNHGELYFLTDGGWIENFGIRVDTIATYRYL